MGDAGTERFRDPELMRRLAEHLHRVVGRRDLAFMHVCGTHENAIARHGLRSLLPDGLRVIAGPGCPVCVCPPAEIDLAVRLALEHGVIVTTYGDMLNVPTGRQSLAEARANGGDVRVVYGAADAVELARATPRRQVALLAVGFETTACITAAVALADPPDNFSMVVSHRLIPPAMEALLEVEGLRIDGFVLPGHVMAVTGYREYEPIAARSGPMVVTGFEPVDIMLGLVQLAELAVAADPRVANAYPRVVRREGNTRALAAMESAFDVSDARWRGLGSIGASGLTLRPQHHRLDATRRFGLEPDPSLPEGLPGCACGQVMLGMLEPEQCGHFGQACTPDTPWGPCMVSFEGTCRNRYLYQGA